MEWLSEDINRGESVLTGIAIGITICLIWFGRKKLSVSIPIGLTFLLLAAIAIPSYLPAHNVAYWNACINNLRAIEKAKETWTEAKHKIPTDVPTLTDLCGTNNFLRFTPACPKGGIYSFGAVSEKPVCSLAENGHKLQ